MLCINNKSTAVYFNLATEEYLLKNSQEDIFMLWQNEPCVVVGRHQNVWAEVDLDFAHNRQIKIARRFSGGGAVYHDGGNLNLTFIENNSNPDFNTFSQRIINFLAHIGIEAKADARRALTIDGLKISGSAQCIHKNRAMFHATLLFSSDLTTLISSLDSTPEQMEKSADIRKSASVKSVKSPVTNIADHLPHSTDIDNFYERIINYFLHEKKGNKIYTLNSQDLMSIRLLEETKYATDEWNYNISARK